MSTPTFHTAPCVDCGILIPFAPGSAFALKVASGVPTICSACRFPDDRIPTPQEIAREEAALARCYRTHRHLV